MKLSIISFTANGIKLSVQLIQGLDGIETALFTKCSLHREERRACPAVFISRSVGEWAREQMEEKRVLLFIGACGIAVRAVAPYITDKRSDSPVLVMDEKGRYVIPVLSGHMGGANEAACLIARIAGAEPVITTATDLNRSFAVDLFAKNNSLSVVNKEGIAGVSSRVLAGEDITISIETGHIQDGSRIPAGVHRVSYPPEHKVDIVVTSEEKVFDTVILLKPKEYVIGMGCRRGKEADQLEVFIMRSMKELGIMPMQLLALASIEHKCSEPGFLKWSRKYNLPFITYSAEELKRVEGSFHESAFVKDKVGVDNVCERAALRACGYGGVLVYEKHAEDGITIAIARREWSVKFDEA